MMHKGHDLHLVNVNDLLFFLMKTSEHVHRKHTQAP